MPKLTYAVGKDSLIVPVLIGINGQTTTDLYAAGQPIPTPVAGRGLIDTGSNYTAIAKQILQKLPITPVAKTTTQTASGVAEVNVYSVSIAIRDASGVGRPDITLPTVFVHDLPKEIEDADVLLGLNVLLQCTFVLDGLARQFSLEG